MQSLRHVKNWYHVKLNFTAKYSNNIISFNHTQTTSQTIASTSSYNCFFGLFLSIYSKLELLQSLASCQLDLMDCWARQGRRLLIYWYCGPGTSACSHVLQRPFCVLNYFSSILEMRKFVSQWIGGMNTVLHHSANSHVIVDFFSWKIDVSKDTPQKLSPVLW